MARTKSHRPRTSWRNTSTRKLRVPHRYRPRSALNTSRRERMRPMAHGPSGPSGLVLPPIVESGKFTIANIEEVLNAPMNENNANNEADTAVSARPRRTAAPKNLSEAGIAKRAHEKAIENALKVEKMVKKRTRKTPKIKSIKIRTRGSLGGKNAWKNMMAALNNI